MRKLVRITNVIDAISRWSGYAVMYLAVALALLMTIEVVCRYGFNSPTVWATESCILVFGVYILLSGAYVLLVRGHVTMDAVYSRFSLRGKAILDIVTSTFFFLFVGILLWKGVPTAIKCIVLGEHSQSPWGAPFWPMKVAIPLGAFLILQQGLVKLIRDLHIAVTGRKLV
ncbi:hypothetical protein ES707_01074 [subsurface metagenome]